MREWPIRPISPARHDLGTGLRAKLLHLWRFDCGDVDDVDDADDADDGDDEGDVGDDDDVDDGDDVDGDGKALCCIVMAVAADLSVT